MKNIKTYSPANLPAIIKNLEELILASSGAAPFEEIMKIIYIKLYEEKKGPANLAPKQIFESAKKEWPGMFDKQTRIEIPNAHLAICMRELNEIKLFNTDLAIIDTAFEYLLPKTAKGSRGQYFTPRHVIDEVVKVLNPGKDDLILDPACGSGGFLLWAAKWAKSSKNIYGIDFDSNMYRICKTMLTICGFGDANISRINFLDPIKNFKQNSFDVIITNPPFGGEIRDTEILKNYELARDENGKLKNKSERHYLFIEKIIKLLKPGGRAAVIVPQGILNNTNLNYLREWIYSKTRILGVIGMDVNTFKPHTNVKTSLLFIQKWEGQPLADYPIFMAVSQKSGKNLSGDLIYKDKDGKRVIDSDLTEIVMKFRKFIAKEELNF